jgi:hypothetical protein
MFLPLMLHGRWRMRAVRIDAVDVTRTLGGSHRNAGIFPVPLIHMLQKST